MQSTVSCCCTSWGEGGKRMKDIRYVMSGVFGDTCESFSSFFVEVFMMVGWVLNICLDEFYLKRGRRKQDLNLMLPYKQKRLEREIDKRRCIDKTVLIWPARHMVCLFVSSGQCEDMHAAFKFLFCTAQLKWFWQLNFDSKHTFFHQACKAQSHVAVQAEERVEREWKISDMSLYVRCVWWYLRIFFVFFRGGFHDGWMSFENMPGWIPFKASLEGGSKTSISCCCTSRRGWIGRWTKEDA